MRRSSNMECSYDDVVRSSESLTRHMQSLEEAVRLLAGRIEPYEGERPPQVRDLHYAIATDGTPSLKRLRALLMEVDDRVFNMERDMNAIRAILQQKLEGTYLRDDITPYIKKERSP